MSDYVFEINPETEKPKMAAIKIVNVAMVNSVSMETFLIAILSHSLWCNIRKSYPKPASLVLRLTRVNMPPLPPKSECANKLLGNVKRRLAHFFKCKFIPFFRFQFGKIQRCYCCRKDSISVFV